MAEFAKTGKKVSTERQVIVTWYTMDEKKPPYLSQVPITFSGTIKFANYHHVLGTGIYFPHTGWLIAGMNEEGSDAMDVEAWADLEPYGGDK